MNLKRFIAQASCGLRKDNSGNYGKDNSGNYGKDNSGNYGKNNSGVTC